MVGFDRPSCALASTHLQENIINTNSIGTKRNNEITTIQYSIFTKHRTIQAVSSTKWTTLSQTRDNQQVTNTQNPSRVELDHGRATIELNNGKDKTLELEKGKSRLLQTRKVPLLMLSRANENVEGFLNPHSWVVNICFHIANDWVDS